MLVELELFKQNAIAQE